MLDDEGFDSEHLTEDQLSEMDAAEQAAFDAVFGESRGDVVAPAATEEDGEDEPKEEVANEEEKTEEQPVLTLETVRAEYQKQLGELQGNFEARIRQIFGKLGEINGQIQQVGEARRKSVPVPETALARLKEEFPEIADVLREDLSELLVAEATPEQNIDEILEKRTADTMTAVEQLIEKRALRSAHPDWTEVVSSPEFDEYSKNEMDDETRQKFQDSWDADYIGSHLTAFKKWKAEQDDRAAKNRERLESAISPTKGKADQSGEITDEDEAFLAGFNST